MAKIPGLKLSQSEVSQTIDLKEVFGVPLTGSEALKQAIGQALIDKIIQRTEDNKDVNGSAFKAYPKEYTESLDFKAFGKKKSDVNLKLTGQMLGTIDIISSSGSKIKIGWSDSEENAKAYNHNVGDTVKKRQFFGATQEDIEEVKAKFKEAVAEEAGSLQSENDSIKSLILKELGRQSVIRGING